MDLIAAARATQKTVDRYKLRQFKEGKFDCVTLMLGHARHMGRKVKVPAYGDARSAASALRQMGFTTLGDAMDHLFTRIPVAEAMAGDVIEMPGQNGFSSLAVMVGNGRVLGFHEEIPHADILQPLLITGAWRIG